MRCEGAPGTTLGGGLSLAPLELLAHGSRRCLGCDDALIWVEALEWLRCNGAAGAAACVLSCAFKLCDTSVDWPGLVSVRAAAVLGGFESGEEAALEAAVEVAVALSCCPSMMGEALDRSTALAPTAGGLCAATAGGLCAAAAAATAGCCA